MGLELADDLASETFVVAFRRRATYDRSRPDARPWLFGIATHLLRHHYRTERRKLAAYAKTGVDPVVASDPGFDAAEDRAQAKALGPALARALAPLRPGDRDALLLLAWADLSYQEIAEALGIPIGTVRSRLARARRQVRELLGADGQLVDGEAVSLEGGSNE